MFGVLGGLISKILNVVNNKGNKINIQKRLKSKPRIETEQQSCFHAWLVVDTN